jgi:2-dehydro-3-deoxyphosphogluconate aldolase / (4S)-4-hydroxy-2-oxoglutarate aldolase
MTRDEALRAVQEHRLIAILRGDFVGREVSLARALLESGVRVLEVSTVSPDYGLMIRRIADALGEQMAIGAGTVLSGEHVAAAADAGASFMVAPNTHAAVIAEARKAHLAVFPGAYTPTEILQAVDCGADAVKLFPATTLGPEYVRAIRGPLPRVRLIPTGGIDLNNIARFFDAGTWAVAVGSELVRSDEDDGEKWAGLRDRARRFVELARKRES